MTAEEGSKSRVLLIDAHPFSRRGIISYLNVSGWFEVVAEVGDGCAAVLAAAHSKPQLAILETTKTGMTAHETVRRLRELDNAIRILVCYYVEDPVALHELLQAGASGLMQKNAEPDELVNAARAVMGGGTYLSRSLISKVFPAAVLPSHATNLYGLTNREIEILHYVAGGFSSREAAVRLNRSVRTIETHRLNIRRKTNANKLSDLVRVARRLYLVRGQADDAPEMNDDDQMPLKNPAAIDTARMLLSWIRAKKGE